jgi:hypothetical protein
VRGYDTNFITATCTADRRVARRASSGCAAIVRMISRTSRASATTSWKWSDMHAGLDSTINIVWNELKYKVDARAAYGPLPLRLLPAARNSTRCSPIILVNASAGDRRARPHHRQHRRRQAIRRSGSRSRTAGMASAEEMLKRIFEPFFTTKPVGEGHRARSVDFVQHHEKHQRPHRGALGDRPRHHFPHHAADRWRPLAEPRCLTPAIEPAILRGRKRRHRGMMRVNPFSHLHPFRSVSAPRAAMRDPRGGGLRPFSRCPKMQSNSRGLLAP